MSGIDRTHIDNVLAQIRNLQQQAKLKPTAPNGIEGVNAPGQPTSFANVLKAGVDQVNQQQARAGDLATAFEKGTPGVELSQVMLEMQKASVSFAP